MNELLSAALPAAELLIIKRDFDLLRKLVPQIKPDLQVQFIPYLALFCYEVIEYLNQKGANVDIKQTSRYSIKDIRQKAKFMGYHRLLTPLPALVRHLPLKEEGF